MPKKLLSLKLDNDALTIVTKYQKDHKCDRTEAISQIIRAYPLHVMKLETKKLSSHMLNNLKEPRFNGVIVMPEVCKHITKFRIDKGGEVFCALFNRYVTDKCTTCPKKEPIKEM